MFNCIFDNNVAAGDGGAIECYDFGDIGGAVQLWLINCLFHDNFSPTNGGAIHCDNYAYATLLNCTVTQNSTEVTGALAHDAPIPGQEPDSNGHFIIHNTIIWGNFHPGEYPDPDVYTLDAQLTGSVGPDDGSLFYSCVMELNSLGSPYPTNQGNIDDDPEFLDEGSDNFRLDCASPAINAADDTVVAVDEFHLWQDADSADANNPDLDRVWRIVGTDGDDTDVDMGAYEKLPDPCAADIEDPAGVEINDMLAVINNWGPCVEECEEPNDCPWDVWPAICGEPGDCVVDQSDLDYVLFVWGTECGESFGGGGGGSDLETVQQCILDALAENLTGEAFVDYIMACFCEHDIIECD